MSETNVPSVPMDVLIGDAARICSLPIETIRYYERAGVVPKPGRTESGQRRYTQTELSRLIFVRRSRELGFSLAEVRAMLGNSAQGQPTCKQVHTMAVNHRKSIRQKLTDLKQLDQALKEMASQCTRGEVPDCAILDQLYDLPASPDQTTPVAAPD